MRRETQKDMKKERIIFIYLAWVLLNYHEL